MPNWYSHWQASICIDWFLVCLFCFATLASAHSDADLSCHFFFSILNPYFLFVCFCHVGDYQIPLGAEEDGPYTRLLCLVCYGTMTLIVLFTSYLPPSVHLKPHCRFFCAPQVSHCAHFHLIIERFCLFGISLVFFSTSPGSSDNPRDVCKNIELIHSNTHSQTHNNKEFEVCFWPNFLHPPRQQRLHIVSGFPWHRCGRGLSNTTRRGAPQPHFNRLWHLILEVPSLCVLHFTSHTL